MNRFSRLPSIEELEEKRLKAADLATSHVTHATTLIEAAAAPASSATSGNQLHAIALKHASASKAKLVSEEADSNSDDDDQDDKRDNDSDDNETDETDDDNDNEDNESDDNDDRDETDDVDTNDTEDNESDDNESDDKDDNETDDKDDNETDDNDSSDTESLSKNSLVLNSGKLQASTDHGIAGGVLTLKTTSGVSTSNTGTVALGTLAGSSGNYSGMTAVATGQLQLDSSGENGAAHPLLALGPTNSANLTGVANTFSNSSDSSGLNPSQNASASDGPTLSSEVELQTSAPDSPFVGESLSLTSADSGSSPVEASGVGTQAVEVNNSSDLNLLEAGFAAGSQSPESSGQAAHSDDLTARSQNGESESLDAVFASLGDDELALLV